MTGPKFSGRVVWTSTDGWVDGPFVTPDEAFENRRDAAAAKAAHEGAPAMLEAIEAARNRASLRRVLDAEAERMGLR